MESLKMKRIRMFFGIAALLSLAFGLNLLAFKQTPFSFAVAAPLGLSLVAGTIWAFLLITGIVRYSAREGKALYGLNTVFTTLIFLGICILLYGFAQHGKNSWDLTQEGRRKLSDQTIQVLQNLNKQVDVTCFFLQIDDELVRIASDKTERFLEQCSLYTANLKVEFLDPQVERARLEGMNITHASTQGTIVIRCGNRQKVITLQGASPRLEERDFTNALINVIRDTQPKICFLTGHGERNVDDKDEQHGGTLFRQLLEAESYVVQRISITINDPQVPADCSVLVINGLGLSGPQSDLHPAEIGAIQAYLDRGGRLMVLLDPWRKVFTDANQTEQLIPWLKQRYGIEVGADMLVSPNSKWSVEFTGDKNLFDDQGQEATFRGCFNAKNKITQAFDQKLMFSAARSVALSETLPPQVSGDTLLRTTPDFFGETDLALLSSQGKASKSADEKEGPLPVAVSVTAKTDVKVDASGQTRDARIIVVGDSDFASNGQVAAIPGNLNFLLNAMAWLTENEELIAIRASGKDDAPVILSDYDQRLITWISILGAVQIVLIAGFSVHLLRRKYQ
jgi:ABC-type uncharacterized transport system involved in gliding motility auxiliary subunit